MSDNTQNNEKRKLVSVVLPCYNEEGNIGKMCDEIMEVMKGHKYDYEIIAVNDGSKDGTWNVIENYSRKYDHIHGINLMGNFGQSCAYMAGFDNANGDYVVTFNADLELPTENLLKVIEHLDNGYDFVNTHRVGRWSEEKAARQTKSSYANKIITAISGVEMYDRGSGLKGYKKYLLQNLNLYGEMHRFIPDYLSIYRPKMIEFEVEFKDREYGESAYKGHKRTIKVLLDLITLAFLLYFSAKPFKMMPGRLFSFTGAVISGLGFLGAGYLTVLKLLGYSIGNRPLLTAATLMIIVGIQSIMMGMIGELMMRTYFESTGRKTYLVRDKTN
jgi:dolichol-phosphate mannosyltransferase